MTAVVGTTELGTEPLADGVADGSTGGTADTVPLPAGPDGVADTDGVPADGFGSAGTNDGGGAGAQVE